MKIVLIVGSIIFGFFILMFAFSNIGGENFPSPEEAPTPAEVLPDDWTKGNPEAKVVLVEYSDFECPACASYYPVVSELVEMFNENINFVYRHFPLEQHPNAHLAARASEAAGKQGMFWEMHDILFERQSQWSGRNARPLFISYAEELNLDIDRFEKDIDSEEIGIRVNRDRLSGERSRIPGTPTFFIKGERIENPPGFEEFVKVIEGYLENSEESNNA